MSISVSAYLPPSYRCVDGRRWRHDPQPDDPYLETDRGECPECGGKGCNQERPNAPIPTVFERDLLAAAQKALNYIENTESELGITLDTATELRAVIARTEAYFSENPTP